MPVIALATLPDGMRNRFTELVGRVIPFNRGNYNLLLQEYSHSLSSIALKTDTIISKLIEQCQKAFSPTRALVFLDDRSSGGYTLYRASGWSERDVYVTFTHDDDLPKWLTTNNRPLSMSDVLESPEEWPISQEEMARIAALEIQLCVPLLPGSGEGLVGWLALGEKDSGNQYQKDDLVFLSTVANQTAIALENARLLEDSQRRTEELIALQQISIDIGSQLQKDKLLHSIVERAVKLLKAKGGCIFLYDPEEVVLRQIVSYNLGTAYQDAANLGINVNIGQDVSGKAVERGEPVSIKDYRSYQNRAPAYEKADFGAVIAIPLNWGNQLLGVLQLVHEPDGPIFTEDDKWLLSLLATQIAIGLENSSLIQKAQQRTTQLSTLIDVSQAITSTLDLDSALELVMDKSLEILNAEAGSVLLTDEDGDYLTFAIVLGPTGDTLKGVRVKIGPGSIVGTVATTGDPLIVNDVANDPRWNISFDENTQFRTRSILCVPMMTHGRTVGVLEVINKKDDSIFDVEDTELLLSFANQAAIVIENARLFTLTDRALDARVQELTMMQFIDRELNATLDFERVMEIALTHSMDMTGVDVGLIGIMSDDKTTLNIVASRGYPQLRDGKGTLAWSLDKGIIGRVARTGKPQLVSNIHEEEDITIETGYGVSRLAVPLMMENEVMGIISLDSPEEDGFTENDLNFISRLTDHAVIAIQNSRLYAETQRALREIRDRAEREALVNRVSRLLGATLDMDGVMQGVVDEMARIMQIDQCRLVMGDEETGHGYVRAGSAHDTAPVKSRIPFEGYPLFETLAETKKAVVVADVNDSPYAEELAPLVREDTSSMLIVPLLYQDNLIGFIELNSTKEPRYFTEQEIELCQTIANQTAVAISNASLYEAAHRANQAKTEFMSVASHELKIPMTSIKGYARLLQMGAAGEISDGQAEFLRVITSNVDRMDRLVQDLLDVSRIEAGRIALSMESVDLSMVIDEVVTAIEAEIRGREQTLNTDLAEDVPHVWGDYGRLVQIFTNLMSNSYKYTPEGGNITVSVRKETMKTGGEDGEPEKEQEMVLIGISDTGFGMSREDVENLFTKFFRSPDQRVRDQPGTGLGLSITRSMVEMHGGEIWCESELNKGTTFYFTLPIYENGN